MEFICDRMRFRPGFVRLSSSFVLRLNKLWGSKKRYQAVGFSCNRMLKWSSSRGIRIDVPVLPVSWSFEDHSVIIQALRKGLIEHEASDTGGVPRWKSSCPDRLAEVTSHGAHRSTSNAGYYADCRI